MSDKRAWAEEELAESNPEALFFDGFDEAILGIGGQFTNPPLVVYSRPAILFSLMAQDMSFEEAEEYLSFNIEGAWIGENTPIIVDLPE